MLQKHLINITLLVFVSMYLGDFASARVCYRKTTIILLRDK